MPSHIMCSPALRWMDSAFAIAFSNQILLVGLADFMRATTSGSTPQATRLPVTCRLTAVVVPRIGAVALPVVAVGAQSR